MSLTLELVRDCFHFLTMFFEVIDKSAPHIYHSALPLSPPKSRICALYQQYAQPFARVVQGLPTLQEAGIVTKYLPIPQEHRPAWSPCSRFLIVIDDWGDVNILDAATLNQFDTLHSLQAFGGGLPIISPDSCLVTLLNHEEITVFDLQTGGPATTTPLELDPPVEFFSSAMYSRDGKVVVFAYRSQDRKETFIVSYNLLSGTHTPPCALEGHFTGSTWTHGEYLQLATVTQGLITIWEVTFTLIHPLAEVESLPAPDEVADGKNFLFLPTLSRLAFTLQNTMFIWDAKASKLLLKTKFIQATESTGQNYCTGSFSPDGCFFAYPTDDGEAVVWRESPTGYMLHQKLTLTGIDRSSILCFSPDGESVILATNKHLRLWSISDQTISYPSVQGLDICWYALLLEISPNETLAAFATLEGNTVTVIDLQSGNLQLVIDVGMGIRCLQVTETTVTVVDDEDIITWSIPMDNSIHGATVDIDDSIQITTLDSLPLLCPWRRASISPDSSHIAIIDASYENKTVNLRIYDMSNGKCLGATTGIEIYGCSEPIFSPDGCEVWAWELYTSNTEGWEIVEDGESTTIKLEPLASPVPPPGTLPWWPSHGCEIMDDEWVLDSAQRHLLWLPHHWRTVQRQRVWSGRFLGLWHKELPRAVVLEFFI